MAFGTWHTSPHRMVLRALTIVLVAALTLFTFHDARMDGDGTEYLTMTHGFLHHATPYLTSNDIHDIAHLPPAMLAQNHIALPLLTAVPEQLQRGASPYFGYALSQGGHHVSIHFWLYSLLAVPFYALTSLAGLNPAFAFVGLNLALFLGSMALAARWTNATPLRALAFCTLLGPIFYLRWTGPEVLSACCVFLAMLATLRRDVALACLLTALGAAQNPSVILLLPAIAIYAIALRRWPRLALLPATTSSPIRTAALLAGTAAVAVLPYLYNLVQFGVPSLIARYFTDRSLLTVHRFASFFLDLNQGLLIGLPALLAVPVLLACLLPRALRFSAGLTILAAMALVMVLAVPALTAVNWNSGNVVMLRYAYWAAMPVAAIGLVLFGRVTLPRQLAALLLVGLLQGFAMWQGKWPHDQFLDHGGLAEWTLRHAPSRYQPDPEIFFERTAHEEAPLSADRVVVYRGPDGPTKVMRRWSNRSDTGGVCPPGTELTAPSAEVNGWEYYDAPFACTTPVSPRPAWAVGKGNQGLADVAATGWSQAEATGIWSDGKRSVLRLPVPPGFAADRIGIEGYYFQPNTTTTVRINGQDLGQLRLGAGPIRLSPSASRDGLLTIELSHEAPISPAELGMSRDHRMLAFFLERVFLDVRPL